MTFLAVTAPIIALVLVAVYGVLASVHLNHAGTTERVGRSQELMAAANAKQELVARYEAAMSGYNIRIEPFGYEPVPDEPVPEESRRRAVS